MIGLDAGGCGVKLIPTFMFCPLYADGVTLIADNEDHLQVFLNIKRTVPSVTSLFTQVNSAKPL